MSEQADNLPFSLSIDDFQDSPLLNPFFMEKDRWVVPALPSPMLALPKFFRMADRH
ncbi:hypothetical protein WJ0W_005433 [Paenibacillus melissococcoides]|uniref:Uncharacterized protein n=1 Tax=Paenibacillus melissococcoides TaxID=2912268 RepID=A0ABM9GAG2_9BACL|nr:hypothetical protein WJ0W_005433 [Paenibacillus melissococcoides]